MSAYAASRTAFDKEAEGLAHKGPSSKDKVVLIEPVGPEFFQNDDIQRCIVVDSDGKRWISTY